MKKCFKNILKSIYRVIEFLISFFLIIPFFIICFISRFFKKNRIGLGPQPLINNVHHKKAMVLAGYDAETFVQNLYYITDDFDKKFLFIRPFNHYLLFLYIIFNYKIIYIYFYGGPLAWTSLKKIEPFFYKLSRVKVVVMPYGGDVQDFNINNDVIYKSAYYSDYPRFIKRDMRKTKQNVKRWLKKANIVISGCDWVNYMPYWDVLTLAHFSIDMSLWKKNKNEIKKKFTKENPLKVLHAPNHKAIKGSEYIINIVNELKNDGYPIEIKCVQKMPNNELRDYVDCFDIVIEQLIIGWYGIFALECMSKGIPVMSYISKDLEKLYVMNGLIENCELPIIKIDYYNLKKKLINILNGEIDLSYVSTKSIEFVKKHHSIESLSRIFSSINEKLL